MIKTQVGRAVRAGAVAAGIVLLSAGTASAAPVSTDNHGAGNGNQVVAPVQAPINICGNAIAVAGVAGAGCQGGADATTMSPDGHTENLDSVGNQGMLSGNQAQAPVQAPINICGNAIAVAGVAGAGCQGGAQAQPEGGGTVDATTTSNNGVGNGNQAQAPIQVPVNICGNAIAVAGVAGAGCQGGADARLDQNSASPEAQAAPTDADLAEQPDGLAAPVERVTDAVGVTHIVDTVTKGGPITTQGSPEYGQPLENGAPAVSHDNAGVLSGN